MRASRGRFDVPTKRERINGYANDPDLDEAYLDTSIDGLECRLSDFGQGERLELR